MKPSAAHRRLVVALLLTVLSCGPQAGVEDDGGGSSTTSSTGPTQTSTGSVTTSSTTTTAASESTTTGVDPDQSGSSTGVVIPEDCSTIAQDCPPGYKCMPYANDGGGSWNDLRCVPIAPDPNGPGEPCTIEGEITEGIDDCDGTSICSVLDSDTGIGTCLPFCMGTHEAPTCPNPCDYCYEDTSGTFIVCLEVCDPLEQGCPAGQACYAVQDTFACGPDASPQDAGIGTPCEFINGCPAGLSCLDAGAVPGCTDATGCCAPWCPLGGADPCPDLLPGTSCVPWLDVGDGPPMECLSGSPGVCAQQ